MSIIKRLLMMMSILLMFLLAIITAPLSQEPRAAGAPTPSQLTTSPAAIILEQPAPNPASIIQYTTVTEDESVAQANKHRMFSHFQLRLGAGAKPMGPAISIQASARLDFNADYVWPSPAGDYLVLMQPVEPGGRPHVVNQKTGETRTLFTDYSGGSFFGWHPDGRHFLFWIDMVGLWLIDAETLTTVTLAVPPGPVQGATISPDGKTIAYITDNLPESLGALWFVSSAGGDAKPQMDTGDVSYLYPHAWSPDGGRLVYYGSCNTSGTKGEGQANGPLCVVDVKTRERQALTVPFAAHEPNWSPDGRYVAATGYASNEAPCDRSRRFQSIADACLYIGYSIYIADTVTGEVGELTSGIAPVWSPDGSMLAFLSNRSGAPEVWTINIADRELQQLTTDRQPKSPYGQLMWLSEVTK